MAIANFFDKSALAASQILQGYDRAKFEELLLATPIELVFDETAVICEEGIATLDLSIRLLARMYPKLILSALGEKAVEYSNHLKSIALAINPKIEIANEIPFASLVIGMTAIKRKQNVFYIGSNEWIVQFNPHVPVGSGNSGNPFGAGASACFGVANIFRAVFKEQLVNGDPDTAFQLSLIDFQQIDSSYNGPVCLSNNKIALNETILVGLGAIGNGYIWSISRIANLEGILHLVDSEDIELSNLQRYVLTTQEDIESDKVAHCKAFLESKSLDVQTFKGDWASFLHKRSNWNLPLVVVAVDNAADRIAIQAALPERILNAWTQSFDLGISRHFDFAESACLACLYPAKAGGQSESEIIAGSLGLLHREREIREILYNGSQVDQSLLEQIAEAKKFPIEELIPYLGQPLRSFYHKVVCGGVLLSTGGDKNTETPLAFQSALAGILLASEVIIDAQKVRTALLTTMTRINLLKPLSNYLNENSLKLKINCICIDQDFQSCYHSKYPVLQPDEI